MKSIIIVIFLLCINNFCYSQKEFGNIWVVGRGNTDKVNFGTTSPSVSIFDHSYKYYLGDGSSSICDSAGNLLLLCNGHFLLNAFGDTIENGDSLTPKKFLAFDDGWSSYSQASIILPFENNIYYVFTPTVSDSLFNVGWAPQITDRFDLLLYHKVDMKLNGGAGQVVQKAVPLLKDVWLNRTQMMACRHADGKNWWLLKQGRDTNMVYKFIVSVDSIYSMGIQGFTEPKWNHFDLKGQTMFSPDGKKYASASWGKNKLFLADFNRCNGLLSNSQLFAIPIYNSSPTIPTVDTLPTGVSFSPNGQFVYVSTEYNLFQLDLLDTDTTTRWYHVANMDTTYNEFQTWTTIYSAPNDKLYIGNWNGFANYMSVIDNPNIKGAGCSFCPRCLQLSIVGTGGNPPCMPNYGLGADSALLVGCWPVAINQYANEQMSQWDVYPNPSSSVFYIKNRKGKTKELYNSVGQLIISTTNETINVASLQSGFYYIRCEGQTKKVIVE